MAEKKRTIVIGAGPIGLEAALYAATVGHDVRVFDRSEVGANVRDWGHVRMFSPWQMNVTPLGRAKAGAVRWCEDACPTGREFVRHYLEPIARSPELRDRVFGGATVVQVGRHRQLKHDRIGDPHRAETPLRVLIRHASGKEVVVEADVVIDSSGVYSNPGHMGDGGIPAMGELENRHRISYRLEDILGANRARYQDKTTLVVGAGHSAATTVVSFAALCEAAPETRVLWAVRADRQRPYELNGHDPLPGRLAITKQAIAIAHGDCAQIRYLKGHTVERIVFQGDRNQFEVTLHDGRVPIRVSVDRIIANVGFGPDNSIYRALQVHECYATRGPMELAAALLGENGKDCLAQKGHGAELLRTPEPNFFIAGHKSYGTRPHFLLRVGHEQVRDIFQLIERNPRLDLYDGARNETSASAAQGAR